MKKMIMITLAALAMAHFIAQSAPEDELHALMRTKLTFIQKHDALKSLPRIMTICSQLQELCHDTQEVCKNRKFALERELAILLQLYLKQLNPRDLEELKTIIKKSHTLQESFSQNPALRKQYFSGQEGPIALLFM